MKQLTRPTNGDKKSELIYQLTIYALTSRRKLGSARLIFIPNEKFYDGIKYNLILPSPFEERFILNLDLFPRVKEEKVTSVTLGLNSQNFKETLSDEEDYEEYLADMKEYRKILGRGFILGCIVFGLIQYIISLF